MPKRRNSGRILGGESGGAMPDRDVTTVKDLIYYQYAKIITRSAGHAPDGTAAKDDHYGLSSRPSANFKISYLLRDELCNVKNNVLNFSILSGAEFVTVANNVPQPEMLQIH